jgi:hypothetical protein
MGGGGRKKAEHSAILSQNATSKNQGKQRLCEP